MFINFGEFKVVTIPVVETIPFSETINSLFISVFNQLYAQNFVSQ